MKRLLILIVALCTLFGCGKKEIEYDNPTGQIVNMSDFGLADSKHFYFASYDSFFELMENKQTVIVMVAHYGCPWCEALAPVVDKMCDQFGYDIYYIDTQNSANVNDTKGIEKIINACKDYSTPNSDGSAGLWLPSLIYLQNGKIIQIHEGTVNTHDAHERTMTEKELARLEYNLEKEFSALTVE